MKAALRTIALLALLACFLSVGIAGYAAEARGIDRMSEAPVTAPVALVARDAARKAELLSAVKLPADRPTIKPILPPSGTIAPPTPEEPGEPLPEKYCMRDEYILYAQHQDKNGYCWNFAATMAAATTIMKATNEYYDFSELWTGITCYTSKAYSKVGGGGSFSLHYKAMQKHGLMLESDLPYQDSYIVSNDNADEYFAFFDRYSNNEVSSALVSDSKTSFTRSDVDAIKRHIYEHGSLYMAFTFRTGFLEADGVYSLTPNQKNTTSNHAISVIGWDDNYEKEFYLDGSDTPTVFKGAWIVLNSYTETNGNDGISMIFYEDKNVYQVTGYRYEKDTDRPLYFYDKIEEGYAYPTSVKGKYYGDLAATTAPTRQLNIFYDDVALTYSYEIASGAAISGIEIYLDNKDVTDRFPVSIDHRAGRFSITGEDAEYGHYKVLVRYGNGKESDTYLNNFFVTHGLAGEELEIDHSAGVPAFGPGRDLEYHSYISSDKSYVFYTDTLTGSLSFLPIGQSVYSEKNMTVPRLSYEITDGRSCTVTHTVTAATGYRLEYRFTFVYCEDTSMQPVTVYYDLGGGTNHSENHKRELVSSEGGLLLYEPTREGYTFLGWYIEGEDGPVALTKQGEGYLVAYRDIYHMGEAPPLYASSYYKQYYNNMNILFVRALWEKAEYTVTFKNSDGSVLGEGRYGYGESPVYSGATPTREEDARYRYVFIGWSPLEGGAPFEDTSYTALYATVPKAYTVTVLPTEHGAVTAAAEGPLTCLESRIYRFIPDEGYRVKDVKVDGVSVGALTSYTFSDVCADRKISVEFERAIEPAAVVISALSAYSLISLLGIVALAIKLSRA